MIYNDHLYAIEDQIEQLISSIKNSQLFRSYCYNKKAMYQDQEVLGLIDSFVHKKTDFEKIAAYGTFAPGYKEQQRALRKAKRALDLNPQVGEFRHSENQLQVLLDEITVSIADCFSEEVKKRRGLIVWVYSLRQLKNLRRFGFVHYVSRKMKYVVMYLNEEDYEMKKNKIEQFHFVRQVEPSYRPDVEMNFAEKIGTDAAYQVSDDGFDVEEKNTTIRLAENV